MIDPLTFNGLIIDESFHLARSICILGSCRNWEDWRASQEYTALIGDCGFYLWHHNRNSYVLEFRRIAISISKSSTIVFFSPIHFSHVLAIDLEQLLSNVP